MKAELLQYLVCPSCKVPLTLTASDGDGEIMTATLACNTCGETIPVVDGIPRFVDDALSRGEIGTRNRFAYAWKEFGPRLSANLCGEFLSRLPGWTPADIEGKVLLDVGCGAGRLARLASEMGAKDVIAIDIGTAVDSARDLSRNYPNIHFVQANLFSLPFDASFDVVYSMGVLHHTPDPLASLDAISKYAKPGGRVGIWVYSREGNEIMGLILNIFRTITVRFPNAVNYYIASVLAKLEEFVYFKILRRTKRFHYSAYLDYFNNFLSHDDRHYVAFDFLSTPLVHYLARDQLRRQAEASGLMDIRLEWFNENGNCMTGVKQPDVPE